MSGGMLCWLKKQAGSIFHDIFLTVGLAFDLLRAYIY